ncbi:MULTISPECIES: glutamate-5-semialdehyde dehydrogenase [Mesonia]|uniref:Gamma-glutamyl phosphate reductase n=1 Tax=Mesonia oceanica TaxID=2687242 RepID=A0AC61YCE5_9FLAO|nr:MULTISPECIES: glutamate-5-semialdehyde dehydrogenase [Mesonia]MAN27828.1 glutamate-5-semialdehyde dehydrogenase [Mesonia sp.]MAQ41007.1 glutamate-5-semialdehyde dehydrogenase [Mesonia sp.]MBJ96452.1 glutamate-5-semialdehyde dehydrogenase [Flavobacteriaceae bacterium]VVV01100.1 Gamma-glutamyl phosphate reductase [Mesonia oceanica]|tara:strand:+ start:71467 stop:72666 length:1200 start_codon:yes stop_codon:yes gene_type:complete
MELLDSTIKDKVLNSMMKIIDRERSNIIAENKKDLEAFDKDDQALYDRLVVNEAKVDGMIQAIKEVKEQDDPVGQEISNRTLDSGLNIVNKTAPFGTIMIIYESRPDVTIEAAVLAFKANNKIYLKGGKEAKNSNIILEKCWHEALEENGLSKDWIKLMFTDRTETREFLQNPPVQLDLIVPRGGERLIQFVKDNAKCAVLISGRGNNYLYVAEDADWEKAVKVILNAKTDKISGCNALDKVLIDKKIPNYEAKLKELQTVLKEANVEILVDEKVGTILTDEEKIPNEDTWYEEFLALKIVVAEADGIDEVIEKINQYSGGHSASIITEDKEKATKFMEQIDSAAVYHNASTRFTDGGQMGVGAELAISTDKLHHRGPLGLKQLVTNKYYVYGDGHVRV